MAGASARNTSMTSFDEIGSAAKPGQQRGAIDRAGVRLIRRPAPACGGDERRGWFRSGDRVDGREQLVRPHRLGDVGVHAGGQALFAVAGHRAGGERHDRDMTAGVALGLANGCRRFEPAHLRHLHVHQDDVERFLRRAFHRETPVVHDRHVVPVLIEQGRDELLVGRIVLGHQHAQDARGSPGPARRFRTRDVEPPRPAPRMP